MMMHESDEVWDCKMSLNRLFEILQKFKLCKSNYWVWTDDAFQFLSRVEQTRRGKR